MNQNLNSQSKNEIFRHLRPNWYDKAKHELIPQSNGGISFMLVPTEHGTYNYWIYRCPPNISFSAKQSVRSLRDAVSRGIVPWGVLKTNKDEALIDQLAWDLVHKYLHTTFSDVGEHALQIINMNSIQEKKMKKAEMLMANARKEYEEG